MMQMKIKLNKDNFRILISLLIFKATNEMIYVLFISPKFAYDGLTFSINMIQLIVSYLFVFVATPFIYTIKQDNRLSGMMFVVLTEIYFIPSLSFIALSNCEPLYLLYVLLFWTCLLIAYRSASKAIVNSKPVFKSGEFYFQLIIWAIVFVIIAISAIYSNFRIKISFEDVYSLRLEAREYSLPTILAYVQSASVIVIPVGIVYYFNKKKWYIVSIFVLIQLLNFSFNGLKTTFLITVIALLFCIFNKADYKKYIEPFIAIEALIAFVFSSVGFEYLDLSMDINRRLFFSPAKLGHIYFAYVSDPTHPYLYLRNSILRYIGFKNPYSMSFPRLIGYYTTGNVATNSNTGLCGDAFANFGWLSLIVYPVFYYILFRAIDKYSFGIPKAMYPILWLVLSISFLNGSFFTVLLNGGVLILILLLALFPIKEENITLEQR